MQVKVQDGQDECPDDQDESQDGQEEGQDGQGLNAFAATPE